MGWLQEHGVPWYDYFALAREYAPFMADGRHFTYYFLPCNDTFPELAEFAARLALHVGIDRPLAVCPIDPSASWRAWSTEQPRAPIHPHARTTNERHMAHTPH